MRGICRGAMVAAEHVLCVSRVSISPCAIVQVIDLSCAVVALVECHGDEAFARFAGVVSGDDLSGNWGHCLFSLEARVQKP